MGFKIRLCVCFGTGYASNSLAVNGVQNHLFKRVAGLCLPVCVWLSNSIRVWVTTRYLTAHHRRNIMSVTLTKNAVTQEFHETEEYRKMLLRFEKKQATAVNENTTVMVEALGVEQTIVQIAMHYQAHKSIAKEAKNAFSTALATECNEILKKLKVAHGWSQIVALAQLAK